MRRSNPLHAGGASTASILFVLACGDETSLSRVPPGAEPAASEADPRFEAAPPSTPLDFPEEMGRDTSTPEPRDAERCRRSLGAFDCGPEAEVAAATPVFLHTGSALYRFDGRLGRAVFVGDFTEPEIGAPIVDVIDIAIDPEGRMYGGTSYSKIYRIDPETAECTLLIETMNRPTGLAALPDGRLVIAGGGISFLDPHHLIPLLGTNEVMLTVLQQYPTSGDIALLPDGQLYLTVTGLSNGFLPTDGLVRVDPATGTTTSIGAIGRLGEVFGLAYADGNLYGFTQLGERLTIDPSTAAITSTLTVEGQWFGAASPP